MTERDWRCKALVAVATAAALTIGLTGAMAAGAGAPTTASDPRNKVVTIETWGSCKTRALVEWAKVAGANHAWMGHQDSPGAELLVGRPFMGFDSRLAVWSYLAAHPRT
ncbi:MAG: hypothetical protein ACRDYB_00320 [Acidimicrobiales bacterium]